MTNVRKTNKILSKAVVLCITAVLILTTVAIADTNEENVALNKTTRVVGNLPPIDKGEVELSYYDPATLQNVIGIGGGTPPYVWQSAIRLTAEELGPYAGGELTEAIVLPSVDNGEPEIYAKLIIYGEGSATAPGSILFEDDTLYFDTTDFYEIPIDPPIALNDHNEIWIACEWEQIFEETFVAYADNGPAVDGKGDWAYFNSAWSELQIYGLDYNWAMGGIVEGNFVDLACDGTLSWKGVESGATVTSTITVENAGDSGSELNWEIDSWPSWGTWTFTPASGTGLTPEDGPVTIQVEVVAPDETQGDVFSGEVKIINSDGPGDFCIIGASLKDAVSQPSLILQFIQALALRFPILSMILEALI